LKKRRRRFLRRWSARCVARTSSKAAWGGQGEAQ
jgi:hypothetical protein